MGWRDQTDLMPKPADLTAPIVAARAGFHRDNATRQTGKELQNLAAPKPLANNHSPFLINSMHLENVLGQVQANRANFSHGRLLRWCSRQPILAHKGRQGVSNPSTPMPTSPPTRHSDLRSRASQAAKASVSASPTSPRRRPDHLRDATEAGAIGAFLAFVIVAAKRRLSWSVVAPSPRRFEARRASSWWSSERCC